jgi:UDP-glucose 4-epimerase
LKILITGADGLLGRRLVSQLAHIHEIHAMVHSSPLTPFNGVTYHVIDLSEKDSFNFLPRQVDAIIHLAQSSHFREFPEQAMNVFNVNIASTARLLEYARQNGVHNFILASSGGVYGAGKEAFKENATIHHHGQLGYYLGSKLCSEVLAQNYSSLMNISVLRFFFIYGKGQKRSMLIPRLIDNVISGQPITIQGDDGIWINPVHVSDAATAVEKCLSLEGSHTFNIAGSQVMSLRVIAQTIGDAVGREPILKIEQTEPRNLIANIDALCEQLMTPQMKFANGLLELLPS